MGIKKEIPTYTTGNQYRFIKTLTIRTNFDHRLVSDREVEISSGTGFIDCSSIFYEFIVPSIKFTF